MAATIQTLATKCEMDAATPLFVGVAWSRGKLPCPLQQFNLKLGEADPLRWDRPVSWDYKSHIYDPVYQQRAREMIYTCSITSMINRSMEFTRKNGAFSFGCLEKQYYSSCFHRLSVFHHHQPFMFSTLKCFFFLGISRETQCMQSSFLATNRGVKFPD